VGRRAPPPELLRVPLPVLLLRVPLPEPPLAVRQRMTASS